MSINIVGFIKSLLPSISKSDMESDMEASMEAISAVTAIYTQLEEAYKVADFQSNSSKGLIKSFYKEVNGVKHKVKLSRNSNFIADTLTLFKNVHLNGEIIRREVEDISNEIIVSQAITAAKSNVIRAVTHYSFITKFAMDVANLLYVNETIQAGIELPKDAILNKKQIETIEKNLWIYARLLTVYGEETEVFSNNLNAINDIVIPKDAAEDVVEAYGSSSVDLFSNLPSNFIGSPIYSVRLVFAQWEADRYKELKDKKKLLELRYLHLRLLKEQGQSDITLEKEIQKLQKRVTDIDYKLSKIEESVHV